MQSSRKTSKYFIIALTITIVGAGMYIFLIKDSQLFNLSTTAQVRMATEQQPTTTNSYSIQTATEDVKGAPQSLSLGFNNAEQVVEADTGTNMVWVADSQLQFVVRALDGVVVNTITLDNGPITLPALARSGSLVSVAWIKQKSVMAVVSTDGGTTFGEAKMIGAGAGVSLAASGDNIVAVWHDDTDTSTSKIMLSQYDATLSNPIWSSPERVDESSKEPLWASVAMNGDDLYVTWRDNRNGGYNVWLRRYVNGVWESEQNVTSTQSGDPDVCVNGEYVAIAHHGKGQITLLQSTDGGKTFAPGINIGSGYFAHISCSDKTVAVAWEYTTGSHKSSDKQTGWAIYDTNGENLGSGTIADGNISASTAYIIPGTTSVEFLWITVSDNPLAGTLRHEVMNLIF